MRYKQVVAHFKGLSKAAQALGINRQNVHAWGTRKRIPSLWQMKLQSMTDGALEADAQARRDAAEMAELIR